MNAYCEFFSLPANINYRAKFLVSDRRLAPLNWLLQPNEALSGRGFLGETQNFFFYAELWLKNALSMLGNYSISRYIIKTNFAFLAGSSSNLFLNAGELSWFNNFHNSLRSKTRRHKNVFSILRHSEIDRMWNAIFISISKWCKWEEKKRFAENILKCAI